LKIISVDNFNNEYPGTSDDRLICENVSVQYVDGIVEYLNEKYSGDNAPRYYKSVSDDYKLVKFEV
jgi:hypothetical protein